MVFDVTIEYDGVLYECGLMERTADDAICFSVDIRIPGYGKTLNTQLHSLELILDPHCGKFKFKQHVLGIPPDIIALETKLNEAIKKVADNN